MIRLRHMVRIGPNPGEIRELSESDAVTFAPMDALADGLGGLDLSINKPFGDVTGGSYNYFAEGDVLLAKVTPCFENGKKAIARGLRNGIGFATSEVHVLRPDRNKIDTRFLRYILCSEDFRAEGMKSMTGAGGLRRVSEAGVLNFRPMITDLEAQRSIADFLDRETARIDQLNEKKQKLAELLLEKEETQNTQLVVRGLDPSVELAHTGVEWMPEAPSHWRVRRIATLFRESEEMGEEGLPILSVSINWGISDFELGDEDRHRIVNQIQDKAAYKRVRPGDLVYNMMRAWQGAFGVATIHGLVSPAYVVARPSEEIHSLYFEPLLRTSMCIEEFRRASKGIADFRQRLYWEHFRQVRVVLPPLEEQRLISQKVGEVSKSIAQVVELIEVSIHRLREFRSALITAAVTGQIDVATWGKRGETDRRLDKIEDDMAGPRAARQVEARA